MKGTALLVLCAAALACGDIVQLTTRGRACNCDSSQATNVCSQSGADGNYVVHENCNQFYQCANGLPHEFFCPEGLLYQPLGERCDWPYNVDCGDRPIVETPSQSNEDNDESVEETIVTCNDDPSQAPNICSAGGSAGTLVAHENCNQYYICDNGLPVAMNCAPNLCYDPCRRTCDYSYNVDCGNRPTVEIEQVTPAPQPENPSTCNCNPAEAPSICAADGSDGILIAHENCPHFYKCLHGKPISYACPSNLFYNPYTEQCDWPENVDCGDRIIEEVPCDCNINESGEESCSEEDNNSVEESVPSVPDNGSEEGGDTDSGNGGEDNGSGGNEDGGSGGGTCNCNPGEAPAICAADGSEGVMVAHENCNQFYTCNGGSPVTLTCPAGLLYNPYLQICDWPQNVDCGDRPIVDSESGSSEDDNDGGNGDGGNGDGDNGDGGNGDGGDGDGGDDGNGDGGEDSGSGGTCNCNPGEAPAICAADGSEGVLVAHENCNQFYKCDGGNPVTLNCPSGLLYNPPLQICDWPYNVECGDRPIVDIESGSSEDENDGGNGDGGNGDGDNGDGGNGDGEGDGNGDGGDDNGSGGTCNCNPGEAPAICAADGSEGVLVAHENCNQFYTCNGGSPVTLTCPAGLLYNPYLQICDWPHNVDCGDRPVVDIDSGSSEDENDGGNGDGGNEDGGADGNGDGGEDSGSSGTCNCNPGEAPAICAADGSEGVLVAHENCNQFYKCDGGNPVTLNCPSGLLYNPPLQICDWPHNVECGDRPIVDIESGSSEDENDGGNGDGGNEDGGADGNGDGGEDSGSGGTCNCNPGEAPAICAADGSEGVLVAHENCNQFYTCNGGSPVTLTCPAGLLYNPYLQICDWPHNVDCGDRPVVDIDSGSSEDENDGGNGDGGNEDGGADGNGDGGEDSGSGGTCNCNPGEAPAICAADGSEGVLVAHENCNQFYKCDGGNPVTLNCPSGLLYNPPLQICDWPYNVECGDRPIVDIESGSSEDENDGGNGDSGSGGNGDGGEDSGSGGTCNCNPGEAPAICAADGSEGVLVAHENCNQFYKCDGGNPVTLNCPSGLLYNPPLQICDWPYNVECGDRPIVDIESGSSEDENDGGNGDGGNEDGGADGNGDGGEDSGSGGTCNCNPGEAPAICAADGSEGVLVAHENCNQFYKCDGGNPITLNCPSGLLYNPPLQICDWPHNVDCGDRPIVDIDSGSNEDGNQGGSSDANSEDSNSGAGNEEGGDSVTGGETAEEDCSEEDGNGGTCNCNPGEAPAICAVDGSDGVLIAHENCNQFYKCDHGKPIPYFCPSVLLYNPYSQICDWPHNVDCGDKPIVDNESNNGGSDENTDTDTDTEEVENKPCNCNPEDAPAICATGEAENVLIAHENCNKFYKCSFGIPVAFKCQDPLLYNPYNEVCDWPANVECGSRPISDSEEEVDSGENENEDTNTNTNCDPSEAPTICAGAGSDGVLVAHENCNQFYVCADGLPVSLSCPNNLLYNSLIEVCDWPSNVDCGDRVIPEAEEDGSGECACNSRQAPALCAEPQSNGKLVAHESCNKYYVCFRHNPITKSCPLGLMYEPHTETCAWPAQVSCEGRTVTSFFSVNKHLNARLGVV